MHQPSLSWYRRVLSLFVLLLRHIELAGLLDHFLCDDLEASFISINNFKYVVFESIFITNKWKIIFFVSMTREFWDLRVHWDVHFVLKWIIIWMFAIGIRLARASRAIWALVVRVQIELIQNLLPLIFINIIVFVEFLRWLLLFCRLSGWTPRRWFLRSWIFTIRATLFTKIRTFELIRTVLIEFDVVCKYLFCFFFSLDELPSISWHASKWLISRHCFPLIPDLFFVLNFEFHVFLRGSKNT